MMVDSSPQVTSPLHWLPRAAQPPRHQFGRADGIGPLLQRLADDHFDGVVTALSNPHVLALLLVDGNLVHASLHSGPQLPSVEGESALRAWVERAEPDASARTQMLALERSLVESLAAVTDPRPETTPLAGVAQLREALRHLATVGHHGVVDVTAGEAWGRVLFSHGRLVGAYQSENPAIVASLAGIGPLAAAPDAVMTVRAAPAGALPHLKWPAARPIEVATTLPPAALTIDDEHDERIESDLLWLLSDVDRDRERASRSSSSDSQLVQVLASFANSMYTMAAQLAASSRTGTPAPQLPRVLEELQPQFPPLSQVQLKGERIDGPALAKRYRGLPDDEDKVMYFGDLCRALLALTRQATNGVSEQLASPAVSLRCATAIEACMLSIELELPSRRFRPAD